MDEVGRGIIVWSRIHASGEHGEEEPVIPATNPKPSLSISQSLTHYIRRGISKLKRERVREEAARREGADAPLEIDATHRHGLRPLVKDRAGRTENQVLSFN
jgi:hypothetical protein